MKWYGLLFALVLLAAANARAPGDAPPEDKPAGGPPEDKPEDGPPGDKPPRGPPEGKDNPYGDFDINDDVLCLCDRLPEEDDISFNSLTGCDKDGIVDEFGACQGGDNLDLAILKTNLECFRKACAHKDKGESMDPLLRKCVRNMRDVIYSFLQFSIPRPEKVVEKSCACDYAGSDKEAPDGFCDMKAAANCAMKSAADGSHVKNCMNAEQVLKNRGCCQKPEAERKECYKQVGEILKLNRIYKYCSLDLKAMLKGDNIGNLTCTEIRDYKDSLLQSCQDSCLFNFISGWDKEDPTEDDAYTGLDYYDEKWFCGEFDAVNDGRDFNFLGHSIYYKGRRNVWGQVIDICLEWKQNGELPQCMKASPYPRPFLTEQQFTGVIDKCCTKSAEEYQEMQNTRDQSENDLGAKDNLAGLSEAICINDADVMNDFGFSSEVLRAFIKTKTGQCWDCLPGKCTVTDDAHDLAFGGGCTDNDLMQPMVCDGEGEIKPDNFWWFLKYLSDPVDRAFAVKACAEGAEFGKGATAYAGLTIGVEAQMRALSSTYPVGYKTLAFLTMHHCGVAAAMEANNYYDQEEECNPYAYPVEETC